MSTHSLNYDYLDQASFRRIYVSQPKAEKDRQILKMHVGGMNCARCVGKIENLAMSIEGIESLKVNLSTRSLIATLSQGENRISHLISAIENLGFTCRPLPAEGDLSEIVKVENRRDILRLGVVGACASNIMMFSLANYFGQTGAGAHLFNWLNLIIFLPVLFYGAWPFYNGFWYSIKQAKLSIDAPIALAFATGSLCSIVSLLLHKDLIYFDSLSGFLFLILLSRYVQGRMQSHFLNFMQDLTLNDALKMECLIDESAIEISGASTKQKQFKSIFKPARDLQPGDLVIVNAKDILPTDATLMQSDAIFDLSFISGESLPRRFTSGMRVPAGAKSMAKGTMLKIACAPANTDFGKLLGSIRDGVFYKVKALNLADKAAQVLIAVVFSLAFLFLFGYWHVDPQEAISRSLALIILACPCAMAFGTPLALSFNLRKAVESGILIKSADVFDKVYRTKHVFVDKTGTLTSSQLLVAGTRPQELNSSLANVIIALEQISSHPAAFAIRDYFAHFKSTGETGMRIFDHHEIPGFGVSGMIEGHNYEIRSPKLEVEGSQKTIAVYRNGVLIFEIFLQEELLPNAIQAIDFLKSKNISLTLLSGDNQTFVDLLGKKIGLGSENCIGNQSPLQKSERIEKAAMVLQKNNIKDEVMMIGDGINDAMALRNAGIGVAVKGSVEVALQTADVYILDSGIGSIPKLFELSEKAHLLIAKNLKISLLYNILGGTGALLGFVNPLVAAILMPISSGFILLNSWMESRK